ncbi:hypothetical protein GCM10010191_08230 [Actinomadura vinacea]|uniref:ABC transmembrane type-1 domain-containing protein n=2 Tax=Actinomadura vinacea TaxID=115336 RepID=A0ABN3IGE2_9ACTN
MAIRTEPAQKSPAVIIVLPTGFVAAPLLLRGRRHRIVHTLLDIIVALPLGIPAVVFGAGFLLTYTSPPMILYGSRWVIVLVYVTLMLPFATRMLLSGMIAQGTAYVEASRVSGAGSLATDAHGRRDRAGHDRRHHSGRGRRDGRRRQALKAGMTLKIGMSAYDDQVWGKGCLADERDALAGAAERIGL